MAKKRQQRSGSLARWYRRLRRVRRWALVGGLVGGIVRVRKARSGGAGGSKGDGSSSPGAGGGGSLRSAPIEGSSAQRRADSPDPPSTEDDASTAPGGAVRTLVSVPPLPADAGDDAATDAAEAPGDAVVGTVVPLTSREATADANDDVEDRDETESSPPLLSLVTDTTGADSAATTEDRPWVEPQDGAECPPGYPVKANDNSRIFHVPGGRFYDRTIAERCYVSAEAAEADGYRPAKA